MRRGLLCTCAVAAALATPGCGDGEAPDTSLRGEAALRASSVRLRTDLAASFDARVWLTGAAARVAVRDGLTAPTALGAARALDTATVALGGRLRDAVGEDRDLVSVLRHQDALALALLTPSRRADARRELQSTTAELARLLARGRAGRRAIAGDLQRARAGTVAALAATSSATPAATERTAVAAARAARPAAVLARLAERRRGSPSRAVSPAGDLAALAATSFTDAAFLQAAATAAATARVPDPARTRAAERAEAAAAGDLGRLVAAIWGEDLGARFAGLWREQSAALQDYARAKRPAADAGRARAVQDAGARTALAALARARRGTAALLAEVDPAGRTAVGRALTRHVAAATAAVRAEAARSPKLGPRLLDVGTAARALGATVTRRAVRQFPAKFRA